MIFRAATEEKFVLEERQRNEAKERKAEEREWEPKLFQLVRYYSNIPSLEKGGMLRFR